MPEKSRLMPISYYNPKQEIRLSAYADTIVLEPDGREQHLRAIRFGGDPFSYTHPARSTERGALNSRGGVWF